MARDEPGEHRAIDEPARAVVAQEQVSGEITDRRTQRVVVRAYGEQKLMLRWRDSRGSRLILAPMQEASKSGAELE
jgi:hypothetical protein